MFELTNVKLGMVKQGRSVKVEYPFRDIYKMVKFESACECNNVYVDGSNKRVVVDYTPRQVPPDRSSYYTVKLVTIFYIPAPGAQEHQQQVTFEATVVR